MSNKNKTNTTTIQIHTMDQNDLLVELLSKQLPNVPKDRKLSYIDLRRVCKFIAASVFDDNKCCIWNSYITNENNTTKGSYINFYFRKRKAALHRLLYINFIGELNKNEYLKFNCDNKGKCCTVSHLKKFKYNKSETSNTKDNKQNKNKKSKSLKIKSAEVSKDKLNISFD